MKMQLKAAPTGHAPTTTEWPTILLPTEVRFTLDVWYVRWWPDSLHPRGINSHTIDYVSFEYHYVASELILTTWAHSLLLLAEQRLS